MTELLQRLVLTCIWRGWQREGHTRAIVSCALTAALRRLYAATISVFTTVKYGRKGCIQPASSAA